MPTAVYSIFCKTARPSIPNEYLRTISLDISFLLLHNVNHSNISQKHPSPCLSFLLLIVANFPNPKFQIPNPIELPPPPQLSKSRQRRTASLKSYSRRRPRITRRIYLSIYCDHKMNTNIYTCQQSASDCLGNYLDFSQFTNKFLKKKSFFGCVGSVFIRLRRSACSSCQEASYSELGLLDTIKHLKSSRVQPLFRGCCRRADWWWRG